MWFVRWNARPNPAPEELPAFGEQMRQELREVLAEGEEDLLVAEAEVADVFVMPWHRSLRNAQADYREHVRAWADYYHASAEDPSLSAEPTPPPIRATWRVAGTSYRDAVPMFDPLGAAERVDELFSSHVED